MKTLKKGYDLNHFAKDGQLCWVVFRRYEDKGKPRLILHEATAIPSPTGGFSYGAGKHWVVSAGTLMGMCRSKAKSAASRKNGKKGGEPKKPSSPVDLRGGGRFS